LGIWGYLFRGLEVLGFIGGGVLVPAVMRKVPYCQSCQRYMRASQLAMFPGSVRAKKVKKSDVAAMAAYEAEQQEAFDQGTQTWESLRRLASDSEAPAFRNKLAELQTGKKASAKLPRRFSLKVVRCKHCYTGWLRVHLLTGQGKQLKQIEFARLDAHPDFLRSILS
jgi:hypothetical protein